MNRRKVILAAVTLALLVCTAAWGYSRMGESRSAALRATADLAACRAAADRIAGLQAVPSRALDQEQLADETTGLTESAARAAGIPADRLVRISPEPAVRLGESAYKEKPTRVFVKGATLRQLAAMMHRLASGPSPLTARSVRLSAPRADDTGDSWNAEIVLTYLIYEPPKAAGREE